MAGLAWPLLPYCRTGLLMRDNPHEPCRPITVQCSVVVVVLPVDTALLPCRLGCVKTVSSGRVKPIYLHILLVAIMLSSKLDNTFDVFLHIKLYEIISKVLT